MTGLSVLKWSRIDPDREDGIHSPKKAGDVGYDLVAMEDVVIPPMQARDVPVNAEIQLPSNVWASIRNRSSMGRRDLYVDQNVVDNGYRGPIFVLIRNMRLPEIRPGDEFARYEYDEWSNQIEIKAGERIGQLVFHQMTMVRLTRVSQIDTNTERGSSGFGSTGV